MAWVWHVAGFAGALNFLVAGSVASVVFFARPSGRLNRRFGLFLWAAGLANLSYGFMFLQTSSAAASAWMAGNYATTIVAFPALWYFAAAVPGTGLGWLDRRVVRIGVWSAAVVVPLLMLVGVLPAPQVTVGPGGAVPLVPTWWVGVGHVVTASAAIVALLFVRAWRAAPSPGTQRVRAKTLAIAMASYLVVLIAANIGQLSSATWRGHDLFMWSYTLAYLLLATIAGYGIVRHQLFDIDLKVKWTLKQSTMAAIFIGLFFVVSESAAAFFSDQVGTYLGIVAAGALVFAIAPLQQFAQRVADRAMPGVKAVGDMGEAERIRVYREQALAAWENGTIDRSERVLLDRLQMTLDLDADTAREIESAAADQGGD